MTHSASAQDSEAILHGFGRANDIGSSCAEAVSMRVAGETRSPAARPAKRQRVLEGEEGQDEENPLTAPQSTHPGEDATRASKRQCLELDNSQSDSVEVNAPSETALFQLPLEILAEILISTGSPQHILAFARTCKRFCHILLADDAQFIWRASRKGPGCTFNTETHHAPPWWIFGSLTYETHISLPDPPAGIFGEAAYAAFLFDRGPCEVCGEMTDKSYASFSLRLKLCKKNACQRNLPALYAFVSGSHCHRIRPIVPVNETPLPTLDVGYSPFTKFGRPSDVDEAYREYIAKNDSEEYTQKFESLKKRNEQWMQFCVQISDWQVAWDKQLVEVRAKNKDFAQTIFKKYGWDHGFLMETTFGLYLIKKTKLLEMITEEDALRMRDYIEVELLKIQEKQNRRKKETSLMENHKDVADLYNSLRSKKAYDILPSLPTFRQLPVISMLQTGQHPGRKEKRITNILRSNALMQNLLDQHVQQWVDVAKQELAVVLGYPEDWKTASKLVLHPVERVTAWFLCNKCKSVEKKYMMDHCLDFAGACAHICQSKNGKNDKSRKGKKAAWNPAKFIKSDKAISVMKRSVQILGLEEYEKGAMYLRQNGLMAVCTSCDLPIVLELKSVVGHCHRHKDMQVSFNHSLDKMAVFLGGFPYESGIVERLLLGSGEAIKKEIAAKIFGCRHCFAKSRYAQVVADSSEGTGEINFASIRVEAAASSALEQRTRELHPLASQEKYVLSNFNGLRSHLKAKHQLESVRDEDVFRFRDKA